jgi:hypothetical protein
MSLELIGRKWIVRWQINLKVGPNDKSRYG